MKQTFLIITLCWVLAIILPADATELRFTRFDVDDGLSHEIIRKSVQDSRGFMWFATEGGLNRFDGFEFKHFPIVLGDQQVTSVISDMLFDGEQYIWLSTLGSGVIVFDPENNTFSSVGTDSLISPRIKRIYLDSKNRLWVGSLENGLSHIEISNQNKVVNYTGEIRGVSHPAVTALTEDSLGRIWIGTDGGGLDVLQPQSGKWLSFRANNTDSSESINGNRIRSLLTDSEGDIWIGTLTAGLSRYSLKTKRFSHFRHHPEEPNSLTNDFVLSLFEDRQKRLWVGTDNGISLYADDKFERILADTSNPESLSNSRVFNVFQDQANIIWISTYSGLNKWNPANSAFNHTIPRTNTALNHAVVTDFAKDSDGRLYVATYGGGIAVQAPDTGLWTAITKEQGLPDNRIMSILIDRDDGLWVGTRAQGLLYKKSDAQNWQQFLHDDKDPQSLPSNGVTDILQDSKNRIWVATYNGGLSLRSAGGFINYVRDQNELNSLSSKNIMQILEDQEGFIWVASENGLNKVDPNDGAITTYLYDESVPSGLSGELTWQIFEDSRGNFWVATHGNGISVWSFADRSQGKLAMRHITQENGLNSNTVYGFAEDRFGNIWFSSSRGISQINAETFALEHFDKSHGLQGYDFNLGAVFTDASGKIYFGGTNGFNQFLEQDLKIESPPPKVELLGVTAVGNELEIPENEPLALGYQDYLVAFDYVALDFAAPEKNQYEYKLSPLDKDWIAVGNLRRATYTNLPSGDYVFSVRATNIAGITGEAQINLPVKVHPAPWRTPLAYSVYVLCTAILLLLFIRGHMKKLAQEEKQRKELERQVAQRTLELAEQNQQLTKLNKELEKAHVEDALTGCKNRHFLDMYLKNALPEYERQQNHQMLVLLIDLDNLKPLNDSLGHAAGDALITHVANVFRQALLPGFQLVRWGGDEFMVVGPVSDRNESIELVTQIKQHIQRSEFQWLGSVVSCKCSMGFAHYPFDEAAPKALTWDQVSMLADKALFSAKQNEGVSWVGVMSPKREINELMLSDLMHCQRISQVDDLVEIVSSS